MKPTLKKKTLLWTGLGVFSIGLGLNLYQKLNRDTSVVVVESGSIDKLEDAQGPGQTVNSTGEVETLFENSSKNEQEQQRRVVTKAPKNRPAEINYAAKQVISRDDSTDLKKTLATGTNFVGKLLTSIDTREKGQIYKVLLPYGGKSKSGAEIPKNTVLLASVKYPGKGEKVFLHFSRAVLPNGKEFDFQAQALSSDDYSPGLKGEFHGQSGGRIAATLGLTMVSGMSDVLTEREDRGDYGVTTPKATVKNGLYQGLSKATEMEAARQASQLGELPEYVTVESGEDLIISLTRSLNFE